MTAPRRPWVDWMKALGLALIVFGHVGGATAFNLLLPPISPKQVGVALFLFVAGFGLAREARPAREVLYRRLFEVYLFGLAAALLTSAVLAARGAGVAASNYLPFVLGANVARDAFPANPPLWYVGTYLHLLVIWAVALRRLPVGPAAVALAAAAEIPLRAALWRAAGPYVAYMAVPNWAAVFLFGLACGRRAEPSPPARSARPALTLGAAAIAWILVARRWPAEASFPFRLLQTGRPAADHAATSAAITLAYLLFTALAYELTRRLPESAPARFFARNSLLVFIAHLPVFALIRDPIARLHWAPAPAAALRVLACFVLPAAASEVIRGVLRPDHWRDEIWRHATRHAPRPHIQASSPP